MAKEELGDVEVEEFLMELAQKYGSQMGDFPTPPDKDTLLKFVRGVVEEQDPVKLSKTANFLKEEVGRTKVPMLAYLHLANYADLEGYDKVEKYLQTKVYSLGALSLGRGAKLLETLFTVRRETKQLTSPKETTKRTLFGETTEKVGEQT